MNKAWDPENRLATASSLKQSNGVSATYGYDALGRRTRKEVKATATATTSVPTTFVSAGAQEVIEITGDLTAAPWLPGGADADTEVAGAAPYDVATGIGARGSLLADPAAVRINFQPTTTDTPDGWMSDINRTYRAQNGKTYGWKAGNGAATDRDHLGRPLYDSFVTARTTTTNAVRTWEYAVPSAGTYTVAIMCGDADSRAQTNHLVVEGTPVRDATPYDGNVLNGYETGSFDGYALTVTVNDGKLTLAAAADSLAPKINFIEISGPNPAALDQATIDRVTAAGVQATQDTARPKAKTPPLIKRSIWSGGYVDDLASYTVKKPRHAAVRYFAHTNHLFSISAITNSAGQVVERYSYNAYGVRMVKNPAGVVLAKTAVNSDRGFTGYKLDAETGLYDARARMYSARLGRFISRDRMGYIDGVNLYCAYFSPNHIDPMGNQRHNVATDPAVECDQYCRYYGTSFKSITNTGKTEEDFEEKLARANVHSLWYEETSWFNVPMGWFSPTAGGAWMVEGLQDEYEVTVVTYEKWACKCDCWYKWTTLWKPIGSRGPYPGLIKNKRVISRTLIGGSKPGSSFRPGSSPIGIPNQTF